MTTQEDRNARSSLAGDRAQLLRSIVDLAPEAIVTIDASGTVLSFSPGGETMFGYHHDEIEYRPLTMLMPEAYAKDHQSHIDAYLETGDARIIGQSRMLSAQRKNGEIFPIRLTVGEAHKGDAKIFIGFIEDVTRQEDMRRKLETALVDLERTSRLSTLGEMAATIAHDLNQPLTGAISSAEAVDLLLARQGMDEAHPARELLQQTLGDMGRVSELVRHVTRFMKTGEVQKSLCDINDIVQEGVLLAVAGADPRVEIDLDLDSTLPLAEVDPVQVQQVVVNLLRNALDAVETSSAKHIAVETARVGDTAQISISDTGQGISAEISSRLFEPMVTSKQDRLGLGLTIVRRMVRAHQGELKVEQSEGTTIFRATFPFTPREEA